MFDVKSMWRGVAHTAFFFGNLVSAIRESVIRGFPHVTFCAVGKTSDEEH